MSAATGWLATFVATTALESAVALLLAPRGRRGTVVAACVALNMVTHPLATLWVTSSPRASFPLPELSIFAFEALGYALVARLSLARSLGLSAAANALTLSAAVAFTALSAAG